MLAILVPMLTLLAADGAAEISYTFERRPGPAVAVTLTAPAEADGTTEFRLEGEWGGTRGHERDIVEIAAADVEGRPLELTATGERSWSVASEPGAPISLTYVLKPGPREPLAPGHNDYRTRVGPALFKMIGNHGLIYAAHLEGDRPREIEFRWAGFDAPGWNTVTSFGPGPGPIRARVSPGLARHALFMAGDFRLVERDVGGGRLGIAIVPEDWGFTDDRFADLAARIVEAQRDFFDDRTDPWYLIALTPNGRATASSLSLGGTGLTNCFALYCNTGLDLSPGAMHLNRVVHLLSHEHFHTWNGMKIRIDAPEGAAYWFSEGFTDFYGRRLAWAAGLSTDEQFAGELNASLSRYDRSPVRNAPNERIAAEFWTNGDVGRLPYARGDMIALALDERIRAVSGGRRSLDDLMRGLYRRAAAGEPPLDTDGLLALIERETSAEFAATLRACILEGADVPIPERLTEPPLVLGSGQMREYDPGFDPVGSHAAGRITGVRPDGPAYEAGLRDGQVFRSFTTEPGEGGAPVAVVGIVENGAERVVRYDALSPPIRVRRYEPVAAVGSGRRTP